MSSLRSRLTLILTLGLGLLLVGAGLWLNHVLSSYLLDEFDQVLLTKARALIALTDFDNEQIEFDFADDIMPEFSRPKDPEYFILWAHATPYTEQSKSLGAHTLPRQPGLDPSPQFLDLVLPNGVAGRLVQIAFVPRLDDDEDEGEDSNTNNTSDNVQLSPDTLQTPTNNPDDHDEEDDRREENQPVLNPRQFPERAATLIVARERTQLDDLIRALHLALGAGILTLLLGMILLVRLALRVGLRPLDDIQTQVTQLDADALTTGRQVTTRTQELQPVVNQLNSMLNRLNSAFARERQFSSDVAHELRTPLAELRALAEVGGRWPDDQEAVVEYFADAHAICEQMEGVVISLLTLARCDRGVQPIEEVPLNLLDLIETSWMPLTRLAREKSQVFEYNIAPDIVISSDRDMLLMVFSNLLGNAVIHSDPKSTIRCTLSTHGSGYQLTISNPADALSSQDLLHLFERFWRKDAARSNGSHSGLGLAIVKAFSDLLHLDIQARIDQDKTLSITLSFSRHTRVKTQPALEIG